MERVVGAAGADHSNRAEIKNPSRNRRGSTVLPSTLLSAISTAVLRMSPVFRMTLLFVTTNSDVL